MNLTTAQIRALLDRYEAADTSLEEERTLGSVLAAPDLDPSLRPYRQWFVGLDAIGRVSAKPQEGPWSASSTTGRTSQLRVVHRAASTRQLWSRIAVAALVLVVFAAGIVFWRKPALPDSATIVADAEETPTAIDWSKYEITDPVEASRITRAALVQVSQHLHRGSELTAEELARMEPIHLILNNRKS